MKKNSNKGFVLAETLVTTVFLMVIFTMIYTNFYPLIGEYEKRENYDTADGKYAAFWIKRSEEHTSELQSRFDLVCRLLLEKKKKENKK